MSRELLENIACEKGLVYIETTTGKNGYPQQLRGAVIGFETFGEAEEVARLHGLRITTFFKRDGCNLYERNNSTTWEPLKITSCDYGDDYSHHDSGDVENFFEEYVSPMLGEFDNFEDLQKFIDEYKKIYEELQSIDETQLVITCMGRYYETIDKESMSWSHDGKTWVIGVIED